MNYQKRGRNDKSAQTRVIYITLALTLAFMAVLIAFTGAWRRTEENADPDTTDVFVTVPNAEVIAPQTERPAKTEPVTEPVPDGTDNSGQTSGKPVEDVLPRFISPVAGYLMKAHSGDTPVFSQTMNDYRPHIGVDLYSAIGNDVYAAADGVISEIWEDPMSGNCLSIAHSGGAVSIYRNLDPKNPDGITIGKEVSAGEVIGTVGDTSLLEIAEEPHVHFEITVNGTPIDPAKYISFPTADTEYEG